MMPNLSPVPSDAFLEVEAGFEYFTTLAHYQSVADRILAVLAGGGRFILLTGSPMPNGRLLANALSKSAAAKYTVIGVPCGRNLTRDDWRRLVPGPAGEVDTKEFSASALLVTLGSPLPLYVLEEADQLSDEQLQEFFASWLFGEPTIGVAVLAVSPAFLARLEHPALSFLIEGLAARLLFQHLGPDEIGTFLRQQLRGGDPDRTFTADTIAAIATASGGDPALVNRLASRTLDTQRNPDARTTPTQIPQPAPVPQPTAVLQPTALAAPPKPPLPEPIVEPAAETPPPEPETAAPPPPEGLAPPREEEPTAPLPRARRRGLGRRLVIGSIAVVAYVGVLLVLGSYIPRYFRPSNDTQTALKPAQPEAPATTEAARPSAGAVAPTSPPVTSQPSGSDQSENALSPSPTDASGQASANPVLAPPMPMAIAPPDTEVTAPASPAPPPPVSAEAPKPAVTAVPDNIEQPAAPRSPPASAVPSTLPASNTAASATDAVRAAPQPVAPPAVANAAVSKETAGLVARGDQLLATGDIISARLYYERAANAGNGHAALLMGETFDPEFLTHAGVRGVRGDAEIAATWYRRARDLGDPDAVRRFEAANPK